MSTRSDNLTSQLLTNTVLGDWFQPLLNSLDKVRFSDQRFQSLPMKSFILFGCLRQFQNAPTLREQVQSLFHMDCQQSQLPVPRSTYSDALSSPRRLEILREAFERLTLTAQSQLPDRLAQIPGLPSDRAIIATDTTYQTESLHFRRVLPKEGGNDNQKGHALLVHFDMRSGIPIGLTSTTESLGEMRILKEAEHRTSRCLHTLNAIHVVDRAYVDGEFWDFHQYKYQSTVITRMKSILSYTEIETRDIATKPCNHNIRYDKVIRAKFSKQPWRLIGFVTNDGDEYEYLTNDFDLEPGIVAFLYYRRWDEEKYFDMYKNDLAGKKAWGKSRTAIEQQALLGMVTLTLTRLFVIDQQKSLGLKKTDHTQDKKYEKKKERYHCMKNGVMFRAYYEPLSKVSRQVWRFLKNCFSEKSSLALYQRQLKPLMLGYL